MTGCIICTHLVLFRAARRQDGEEDSKFCIQEEQDKAVFHLQERYGNITLSGLQSCVAASATICAGEMHFLCGLQASKASTKVSLHAVSTDLDYYVP